MQALINVAFASVSSIRDSLALLQRFRRVLQTETLRLDLENKLIAVFTSFFKEIEVVKSLFEAGKKDPPTVRNMPPGASCVCEGERDCPFGVWGHGLQGGVQLRAGVGGGCSCGAQAPCAHCLCPAVAKWVCGPLSCVSPSWLAVSGTIMWARHLLKRITEPMKLFETQAAAFMTHKVRRQLPALCARMCMWAVGGLRRRPSPALCVTAMRPPPAPVCGLPAPVRRVRVHPRRPNAR